jgi:hypothetical protein
MAHTGEESLLVLELACKYNMGTFKQTILSRLQKANGREDFVDLLVAARMVDSKLLCDMAVKGLINSRRGITFEEAGRIGLEEYYALWNPATGLISCASCGLSEHLSCCAISLFGYYRGGNECSWE